MSAVLINSGLSITHRVAQVIPNRGVQRLKRVAHRSIVQWRQVGEIRSVEEVVGGQRHGSEADVELRRFATARDVTARLGSGRHEETGADGERRLSGHDDGCGAVEPGGSVFEIAEQSEASGVQAVAREQRKSQTMR